MKTRGPGVLAAGCLIVAALWPGPVHAAVTGTLTANSGVLYDDCRDVAVGTYTVAFTPDVDHWNLDIDITAPDGTIEATGFYSSFFDASSGTIEAYFCGSEMPGTYTISGSGVWSDYETDRSDVPWTIPAVTFTMRQPKSKITAKGKQGNRAYVINVTVKDERPNGFFPTDFATVKLQKRVGGRWVALPGAKEYTDSKGRTSFVVSTSGPSYKVRAVKPPSNTPKAVSNAVKVP